MKAAVEAAKQLARAEAARADGVFRDEEQV